MIVSAIYLFACRFLIADLKDVTKEGSAKRFRVTVSDGVSRCTVMLSSQCNFLVTEGRVNKGTIIEVNSMMNQIVSNKL